MQISLDIFNGEAFISEQDTLRLEPHQLTLAAFLSEPKWKAYPDPNARGESKGQYKLLRPDGREWSFGWIGKHPSEEAAKRAFHEQQVHRKIHGGAEISELVLAEYPQLLEAQRNIHWYMNAVRLSTGRYVAVRVGDADRHFHILDFPMYDRVSTREFVRRFQLEIAFGNSWVQHPFNDLEIASIALARALKSKLKDEYRPHFTIPEYRQFREGQEVRFRQPIAFDNEGCCTVYEEYEGIIFIKIGSCFPHVRYQTSHELCTMAMHPSMLLAVKDGSGCWRTIEPL